MLDFRGQVVTHNEMRTAHIFIKTKASFSLVYDNIDIMDGDNFAIALNWCTLLQVATMKNLSIDNVSEDIEENKVVAD